MASCCLPDLLLPVVSGESTFSADCVPFCRSMFLVGPWKQIKNMFDSKRVISTAIYLVSIMFTLIAAWKFHSVILCMIFIVIQFAAYIW